ncbi:MAG: XisI protein [Desulfobacteraceae bacterium]|nr:XisI protein [Desulfobacteraceae bacterium]
MVHQCVVHIDICDGDVVIQWNDTEDLPDEELAEMGIPKSRIRSEIIPPEAR